MVMQAYHWASAEHLFMGRFADSWVVLDLTQLRRKSWMTRNRLRNSNGVFWFGPKVSHSGTRVTLENARVVDSSSYAKNLLSSLDWYVKKSPNGKSIRNTVKSVLESWDGKKLVSLNTLTTEAFFDWLDLKIDLFVASEIQGFPQNSKKETWALDSCLAIGAGAVINPRAGTIFFDTNQYRSVGISLAAYACDPIEIRVGGTVAAAKGLSWIDTASWISSEEFIHKIENGAEMEWLVGGASE